MIKNDLICKFTNLQSLMFVEFLRHAESIYNESQIDIADCPLSQNGIQQAKKLTGNYEFVIVSPLQRSQETLNNSQITYNKLVVCNFIREVVVDISDTLSGETFQPENVETVVSRESQLKCFLTKHEQDYASILIVSHKDFIKHLLGVTLQNAQSQNCMFDVDTNNFVKI